MKKICVIEEPYTFSLPSERVNVLEAWYDITLQYYRQILALVIKTYYFISDVRNVSGYVLLVSHTCQMYLQRDVPLFVLFMSCQSISITYRRAVAAGWPEGHNLAPLDEASATMSCWASTASLALGMTLVRMFAQWGGHLESELENKIYSYRVSQKRDLQNFDNSSLNKVEPYAQTTIFQYQKISLNVVDTKDPKILFFLDLL